MPELKIFYMTVYGHAACAFMQLLSFWVKSNGNYLSHKILEVLSVVAYFLPLICGSWILVNLYGMKYRETCDDNGICKPMYVAW